MLPSWRKHCRLHPAPPLSECRCDLGPHSLPQLRLALGSFDGIKQIDERLEAGVAVRGGKLEVYGQAGKSADTKIVRMACAATPKTRLGFDRSTELTTFHRI
jgi:hypothetical protein